MPPATAGSPHAGFAQAGARALPSSARPRIGEDGGDRTISHDSLTNCRGERIGPLGIFDIFYIILETVDWAHGRRGGGGWGKGERAPMAGHMAGHWLVWVAQVIPSSTKPANGQT